MKRVFIKSFGCRASQADGAAIGAALEERGCETVEAGAAADLIVINTCTVTREADTDARRAIRSLHRDHPHSQILVTGCYAQRAPDELASLEGVTRVVGNSHKAHIAEIVSARSEDYHGQIVIGDISRQREFSATAVKDAYQDRSRPNLKVQDGCGNRCAFCIIPQVRGRSRSASLGSILSQMQDLAERYAEVVLSGINLGRWGRDLPDQLRFCDLIRAILRETSIRRLRISSVEPMDWSEDLLALVAQEPRMAKHVHIPLQSGSDAVLKRMFRKYRTRHYETRLHVAQRLMPEAAIGADVMTGFPGETDAEFSETVRFIEQHPFTYLHVFTYSERPGTAAASFGDAVPIEVRRERTRVLRALSDRKNLAFRRGMIGRTLSAVTLGNGAALTTNFLQVELERARAANELIEVEVGGVSGSGLRERTLLPVI